MYKAANNKEFNTKKEAEEHDYIIALAEQVMSTVLNGTGVAIVYDKNSHNIPYNNRFTAGLVRALEHQTTRSKIVQLLQTIRPKN